MTFGDKIRELRRKKGWSVYDLADRIKSSPGYVSKIEARSEIPSPDMIITLSEILGANTEELIVIAKEQKAQELTENVSRKYDKALKLYRKAKKK